jgi:DNA-binding NarL/FixJ family response regulator
LTVFPVHFPVYWARRIFEYRRLKLKAASAALKWPDLALLAEHLIPSHLGGVLMSAKILIVDDHDVVRHGVRSILVRARPEWEICGEATNGSEAVDAAKALKPDIIVLDITMPGMSGLEAASQIAKLSLRSRVLIFSMHESNRLRADIREAGAHGFVHKSQAGRDLIFAVEQLLAGGTFFDSEVKPACEREKNDKQNPRISFFRALTLASTNMSA